MELGRFKNGLIKVGSEVGRWVGLPIEPAQSDKDFYKGVIVTSMLLLSAVVNAKSDHKPGFSSQEAIFVTSVWLANIRLGMALLNKLKLW